ncbi:MAG: hypothetical protein MJE68_10055 [Proteobacteria bacterium]|nr:hypothetical protein [Pseudomonadota bacterium]
MLCYKTAKKKRLKYLVRQASIASADNRIEQEMFSRHGLVITNEPGGGEQDTSMTTTRWEQRYVPMPARQTIKATTMTSTTTTPNRNQERHVKFDLSKTSYNSSNDSIAEPENVPVVIANPGGRISASSPTIQAELEDRVRSANEEYRSLDSIREYEEEGECSEASSLSDICAGLEEGQEYTVEHLMKAGPQFSQFVSLLESIIEEEEELNDSGESEIAHTGMTQATPLTGMTLTTTQMQTAKEFPYY